MLSQDYVGSESDNFWAELFSFFICASELTYLEYLQNWISEADGLIRLYPLLRTRQLF